MTGQPNIAGWLTFDVTDLQVTVEPSLEPSNVVPAGVDFDLTATFTGSGTDWNTMKNDGLEYNVTFHAESIGLAAPEIDFTPAVTGNLIPPDDTYQASYTANVADKGIYKMGCVVTFPAKPGVVGFYTDLVIQVYA